MAESLNVYTVILGDLIGSSYLQDRQELAGRIEECLTSLNRISKDFHAPLTLSKGMDELTGVLVRPGETFRICMLLNEEVYPLNFRFAVAEGSIDVGLKSGDARKMDGQAFHKAARIMRSLKSTDYYFGFDLAAPLDGVNSMISQLANLAAVIAAERTPRQNEIFRLYRMMGSQVKVADKLGISQQAVSDALRSARWNDLLRTEQIITEVLDRGRPEA